MIVKIEEEEKVNNLKRVIKERKKMKQARIIKIRLKKIKRLKIFLKIKEKKLNLKIKKKR